MAKTVLSIQIGHLWTKVCVVNYQKATHKIPHAFTFKTPEGSIDDGYIRDQSAFGDTLLQQLHKHGIKERDAVFTLASSKIVIREVTIPSVKDKKIMPIIESQMSEYFPMDVSDYVVSYTKMAEIEEEDGKKLKLSLIAVPENLLGNYYALADRVGLKIESFDYIGNSTVQMLKSNLSGMSIIVQLEEQSTIISVLNNKKMEFQRVTPSGYLSVLQNVMNYEIFGVKDEYSAFNFLLKNEILFDAPEVNSGLAVRLTPEETDKMLNEALDEIRDSLNYYLRLVDTALEYYQNQLKGTVGGQMYLVGDGARLAGFDKLFAQEMTVPLHEMNYESFADIKKFIQDDGSLSSIGFLSVTGAPLAPMDIRSKERLRKEEQTVNTRTAWLFLAVCIVASAALAVIPTSRRLLANSEKSDLEAQIESLSYIQTVYNENQQVKNDELIYSAIDDATACNNDQLLTLIGELERVFPKKTNVQSIQVSGDTITMNITSAEKMEAAQLLMELKEVACLQNLNIPSVSRTEDSEGGAVTWNYTLTATYRSPEMQAYLEAVESGEMTEAEMEEELSQ